MTAARKLTADDLFALGEDVRAELIHGEIVPKAMGYVPHSTTEGSMFAWATRRFHRKPGARWPGGWWILTEIHTRYASDEVFCHDVAGWRRDRVESLPRGAMTLRPDWVCEVLSPGHAKRDLVDKLGVMHAAEVPDYWVIDHEARILTLYSYRPDGYLARSVAPDAVIRARPFDAVELRVACLFGDEDDEE